MKRILITLALLISSASFAFAQDGSKMLVGGGFYAAKQVSEGGGTTETCSGPGFYLAAGMSNNLFKAIDYTMEFFYETYSLDTSNSMADGSLNESNIGYDIKLMMNFPASDSMALLPHVGCGFMYGLSSPATTTVGGTKTTANCYNSDDMGGVNYQRMDTFLIAGAAINIGPSIRVDIGAWFGMWNRITNVSGAKTKDGTNLRLGVYYMF